MESTISDHQCPFCDIRKTSGQSRILKSNEYAFLIRDGYPVTEGHSLIIPNRHVSSFFNLKETEREAMWELVQAEKAELDKQYKPAAYNLGINDGPAAGQTVPHCHLHVIPRYEEPNKDPRGGVRWVIPEKADYWSDK